MTSALIAPVIPPRAVPWSRPRGRPGIAGTLPLAVVSPEQAPALAADVVYGLGRIDASGRVADRTVTCALGWHGGDRLTLTASAGVVTARRDPHGLAVLPPRHCITIPATLRYRCGLLPGDPVLLAARPAEDTLTAYSLAVVNQALTVHIPFPAREGGDR
jgi:hypothetical protein